MSAAELAGMTFEQALAVLEDRQETRIELGLERVRAHLERLGSPHHAPRFFHVAGTNGKGSVCARLDSILRAAGFRTGFYSSPHLLSVRERVKVGGEDISESDFARLLGRALAAETDARLTYFELLTSVAFQYFAERQVEFAVLETGLGGRLDATNVIEAPLACVITSISFDHMSFLGDTLAAIAAEKAGIIKPGRPVLVPASLAPEAAAAISRRAASLGGVLTSVPGSNVNTLNDALAVSALKAAGVAVGEEAIRRGLAAARWPGRFEVRRLGERRLIIDGAHNEEAMRCLAWRLRDAGWADQPARWVIGMMRDKDSETILRAVAPLLREAVAVAPKSPRALPAAELARRIERAAPGARVSAAESAAEALAAWRADAGAPSTAILCGSLYLYAEAPRA